MYSFIISTVLIAVITTNVIAFPQNGLNLDRTSEVDGFVFDGPIANNARIRTTRATTSAPITPAPTTPANENYDRCIQACLTTAEYNPVCGTDNVTYDNPGRLGCATSCGKNINLNFYGRCATNVGRG